jgi:putative peptide maturation system protein
MPDLDAALRDTLAYLRHLAHDGVGPTAALAGLSTLEQRHPETSLDLVWLEEPYDRSIHYDALIRLPDEGTVSLSFSPDGGLPWPLRGVQRWLDRDLARVNDVVLDVDHAIAQLDFIWDEAPIVRRLVDTCLIQETLKREPIALDDADLQEAMDAFRRARGLFAAEDTHRWLAEKGLSAEKLEQLLRDQAMLRKLRERVASGRVEEYFAAHGEELAELTLLRLDFPDEVHAYSALDEVRSGRAFLTVAQSAISEAVSRDAVAPVLESVQVRRRDVVELPITAQAGEVLGPIASKRGAALLQVVAVRPEVLDKRTRHAIAQVLFEDWLAKRRHTARIQWYWGNATQAAEV